MGIWKGVEKMANGKGHVAVVNNKVANTGLYHNLDAQGRWLPGLLNDMQAVNEQGIIKEFKFLDLAELLDEKTKNLKSDKMSFYKVNRLSYDEEFPQREAFENVLLSLNDPEYNFIYILQGNENGVELHIGVVKNTNKEAGSDNKGSGVRSAGGYSGAIANAFRGNFPGSELEEVRGKEKDKASFLNVEVYKRAGMIVGVPSVNEQQSQEKYDFQGMDRLINSMMGKKWRLVLVCEPVPKEKVGKLRDDIYEIYGPLALLAKQSVQQGMNNGGSENKTDGTSQNQSDSVSTQKSDTRGESWNDGKQNKSTTKGGSEGHTEGTGSSHSESKGSSWGSSLSASVEVTNKRAVELRDYIDEEVLERMKLGYSKGLFKTSVYYMAENNNTAIQLKTGLMALFQGNKSSNSPLTAIDIEISVPGTKKENDENKAVLNRYQNCYIKNQHDMNALALMSRPCEEDLLCMGTYLTAKEISLLAGLPQKEVPGLPMCEAVEFGLNEKELQEDKIDLGCMLHKGREMKTLHFFLNREALKKHTFVAGVTGSGKTTTCHKLLLEADKISSAKGKKTHFLVIEPAKTEYRTLLKQQDRDCVVFTLGNEMVAPFRINPFELIKGEVISSHIDMVKATFTSAFPMEASMPQLLEEAIYMAYEQKGWNVDTNSNDKYGDKAFTDPLCDAFPTLSELLGTMERVVETKKFSDRMAADYKGSLVSRLSNLTVGSKGAMLNCAHSIDFGYLVEHNVVLEMDDLKSPEDKALVMGFILSRLAAVVRQKHDEDSEFTHLTLVEEAHRLLSKVEYGDSGAKKVAVETFTDLLAEVRKYGEGLIIVDQIPNKLATEVLKNTNTKIIHRIFAKDDKQAVGNTMMMDEKQEQYLSAMDVGEAVVFTENTEKPVNIKVKCLTNTSEETPPDTLVREKFMKLRDSGDFGTAYDDMDIKHYYKDYERIMMDLGVNRVDEDLRTKMLEHVNNLKQQRARDGINLEDTKEEDKHCWAMFVKHYDKLNGKTGDKRADKFAEFFANIFVKPDFGEKVFDYVEDFENKQNMFFN